MNPTKNIVIQDMPRYLRNGFIQLNMKSVTDNIANGNIISEVGDPHLMELDCIHGPIPVFDLRKPRKYKMPIHMFGKAWMRDAFSALTPRVVSAPTTGTRRIIQPRVTPEQKAIMDLYRYGCADFIWIVHIPSPLGASLFIEASVPEIDNQTKTLGVKWRPSAQTTIAFYAPWNSDVTMVPLDVGRPAQSGGALVLQTLEDNSTNEIETPLLVTLYQATVNIRMVGLKPALSDQATVSGFEFKPLVPALNGISSEDGEHDEFRFESEVEASTAPAEVNAESAVLAELPQNEASAETVSSQIEKPAQKPTPPPTGRKNKPQQAAVSNRWFKIDDVTLEEVGIDQWFRYSIDPTKLNAKGDSIARAYRRNVWAAGDNRLGYSTGLQVKLVINRPPSISGLVEVQDSENSSSRYTLPYGETLVFGVVPDNFSAIKNPSRPRYPNSPYLRTDEFSSTFRYRIVGQNRKSDVSQLMLSVFVKAGGVTHDVPTKPYPVANSRFENFLKSMTVFLEKHEERYQQRLAIALRYESEGMEEVNEQYMAPQAGEDEFLGNVVIQDEHDPLEQDEFPTEVFNGRIPLDQIFVLPMNLQNLVDLSGNNGLSVISERFNRFAQIVPSRGGSLGPKIGKYIMEMRMPTSIAGNVEHVFIPGDMIEEAAALAFGLSTILGMATSALSAFGGPLIGGIIETGRNLLGNLLGLGGKPTDKTNNTTSITGDIELSRFMNFFKPAAINELVDPVNGALALKIRDVLSTGAEALHDLPARIWATMQGAGVERELS